MTSINNFGIFNLEILKPEQKLFSGKVQSVKVRGLDGWLEILSGHAPLMTVLEAGQITYHEESKGQVAIDASDGILCVQDNCARVYLT